MRGPKNPGMDPRAAPNGGYLESFLDNPWWTGISAA
jgi:hypothetical protein